MKFCKDFFLCLQKIKSIFFINRLISHRKWVNEQPEEIIPIAFDMEWPFSFKTGPGKSALIQICAITDVCYLYHLTNIKKLPAVLLELLCHKKVKLHGVNIKK